MPVSQLTPAELRAQLKKATLPTLLIEGKTDLKVFRSVLRRIGSTEFALQPCGSRNDVLDLFRDRASFPQGLIAFLADRDFWIVEGVPAEYRDMVLTKGYSIENELYADGKLAIKHLLYPGEENTIDELLARVIPWVAHEYSIASSGGSGEYAKNGILDERVMARYSYEFQADFLQKRGFSEPSPELIELVTSDDLSGLPGKIIFQVYFKVLHIGRGKDDFKYSEENLHDQCIIKAVELGAATGRIQALLAAIRLSFRN